MRPTLHLPEGTELQSLQQPETPTNHGTRFGRYVIVTLVATPVNFALYAALLFATVLSSTLCNFVAAAVVSIPTYFTYRLWVWSDRGKTSADAARKYWATTLANVLLSTAVLVALDTTEAPEAARIVAPITTYTVLWLVRFVILERVVFVRSADEIG